MERLGTVWAAEGQESDTLEAEKLRIEVELENLAKIRPQKAAATGHQKEVEQLRTKPNESSLRRQVPELDVLHPEKQRIEVKLENNAKICPQ
ncbi:hypothetical protein PRZ48_011158 [Zasmidium cellare]|uniref:Uncharacterized protein n=1 Tax=Zasmidium cellare TaxID=395010 RepID=A0ABR0EAL7_ZASCE|nr:hypothetical protein PRZ48_011158 [Zasmidium cellare]